jgi:hypothetical protein
MITIADVEKQKQKTVQYILSATNLSGPYIDKICMMVMQGFNELKTNSSENQERLIRSMAQWFHGHEIIQQDDAEDVLTLADDISKKE